MVDILTQLLIKLNANVNLKDLVTTITPFGVFEVNNMYYKAVKLSSDGVTGQMRFELTAVCDNYINAIKAITETEKTLLTLGDNKFNNDILTIRRNGGGSMKNDETKTYHEAAIFTITYKERI